MTTIQDVADRAAAALRDALEPWAFAETRRQRLEEWRGHLAHALAEDRTGGVTVAEMRLAQLYPRKSLTLQQIERAVAYRDALAAAYAEIPHTYDALLHWCEQRSAAVAV